MASPVRPRCYDCAFATVSVVRGYEALTCHRYAPRPLVGGSGEGWANYEWPVVAADDFCGEFKHHGPRHE